MLGTMDDIVMTYFHIYEQGYVACILDPILEDWTKLS